MTDENLPSNLPSNTLESILASIPEYLIPRSVKALDRLIGAAVDIPVAWLRQHSERINSKTTAYASVEKAIAEVAAERAASDPEIVEKATQSLIRKAYRKQSNLEAVAVRTVEELRHAEPEQVVEVNDEDVELDQDWLNIFERYAEDASSDRMQNLWGRILAGEIRKPGRFSLRTLRYISEISQQEATKFGNITEIFFQGQSPKKLIKPDDKRDISELLFLEENGLIQGASGLGLTFSLTVPQHGYVILREGNIALALKAEPGQELSFDVIVLTKLGSELISLIPDRNLIDVASRVADGYRSENIKAAYIFPCHGDQVNLTPIRILWVEEPSIKPAQE